MSYHRREHGSSGPDIQRIIVVIVVNQQLRSLEVPRCHPHVVILTHVVELSQPPVDQLQDLLVGVDDDVLRLDVAVHDALAVAVVQSLSERGKYLEQLIEVVPDLEVRHVGDQ